MANNNPTPTESKVPYVFAYGNITKALDKIQQAAVPPRFTQDFLATKLALKGGNAKPVIPFLKRIGFLGSDGVPTELYKRFRNPSEAGAVAAAALQKGFTPIFEINEYAQDLKEPELKGVVVQATGLEGLSSTVRAIVGSFNALKKFAKFDESLVEKNEEKTVSSEEVSETSHQPSSIEGINLGYTINLHLPATSDIAVFDAIFRSLREHLMRRKN
jgi:hypothetical protein